MMGRWTERTKVMSNPGLQLIESATFIDLEGS